MKFVLAISCLYAIMVTMFFSLFSLFFVFFFAEVKKGVYPYRFNTVANWNYVGIVPELSEFFPPYADITAIIDDYTNYSHQLSLKRQLESARKNFNENNPHRQFSPANYFDEDELIEISKLTRHEVLVSQKDVASSLLQKQRDLCRWHSERSEKRKLMQI